MLRIKEDKSESSNRETMKVAENICKMAKKKQKILKETENKT